MPQNAPYLLLVTLKTKGGNKEGLYPVLERLHVEAGFNTRVLRVPNHGYGTALRHLHLLPGVLASLPPVFWLKAMQLFPSLVEAHDMIAEAGKPAMVSALSSARKSGYLACILKHWLGTPYLIQEHYTSYARNSLGPWARAMRRRVFLEARQVVVVSAPLADALRSALDLPGLDIAVIGNPAPEGLFGPLPAQDSKQDETFIFAAWTRWRKFKRLDLLLEAFALVRAQHPQAQLRVAGQVPRRVRQAFERGAWPPGATYLGVVNRDGVRDLARGCDACVIPSDHETFGLPAIEAMAAGQPVVTTRCGGPETVVTPDTGVTVEKGNARALADAMTDVLRHPHRYDPAAIQRHCHENFGETATREKWRALLQKLL